MKIRLSARAVAACTAAAIAGVTASSAAGDAVYHTEHLALVAKGSAPLRSGFVQNIKAEGLQVYAHELFVVNGAEPNTRYTVTRHFYGFSPACRADALFVGESDLAVLETNTGGNARQEVVIGPEDIPALLVDAAHGVRWTVSRADETVAYETACTSVFID